jgi:putative FmdB family regulatory protein
MARLGRRRLKLQLEWQVAEGGGQVIESALFPVSTNQLSPTMTATLLADRPIHDLPAPVAGLESSCCHQSLWEVFMSHHEYFCKACKRTFSKVLTISEHDSKQMDFPHCGSQEVEQSWSVFSAVTSKKSA